MIAAAAAAVCAVRKLLPAPVACPRLLQRTIHLAASASATLCPPAPRPLAQHRHGGWVGGGVVPPPRGLPGSLPLRCCMPRAAHPAGSVRRGRRGREQASNGVGGRLPLLCHDPTSVTAGRRQSSQAVWAGAPSPATHCEAACRSPATGSCTKIISRTSRGRQAALCCVCSVADMAQQGFLATRAALLLWLAKQTCKRGDQSATREHER